MDSADAWTNPAEFFLDDEFQPTVVAGVRRIISVQPANCGAIRSIAGKR
ncbi:MAG: hypothetical protein R2867_02195 [Caldilineaceae bacterium]